MEDILDFDEKNGMVDYLFLQSHQLEGIVKLLEENMVPHKVRVAKHLDDTGVIPLTAETVLNRCDVIVQVAQIMHSKVDYLMAEHPELLEDSEDIRTIFLENSLDDEGLIEILLYPEDWEDGDVEIATGLLKKRGVQVTQTLLDEQGVIIAERRAKAMKAARRSPVEIFFIVLIIVILLYALISNVIPLFSVDPPQEQWGGQSNGLLGLL